ncbi:MAG: SH3 domain-containing protein [Bacillota bacterium]|nr:SH3 domain-containing protein [Bacillota bacterium]
MKKITAFVVSSALLATSMLFNLSGVQAGVQSQISRSKVEQRAFDMINLNWTFSSSRNSVISPTYASAVTLPIQFVNKTTLATTGIPYAWGGLDSLNTNSYEAPWVSFIDSVNKGAFTGNVNAHGGLGYVPGTSGLDCSGFIQAAFDIKDYKQSTTTLLNNYFNPISLSDIKHMDILDLPGSHVVIFDSWGSWYGIEGAFTYEATPDQTYGGIQGTKKYFISKSQISKGYVPARYKYIIEDQAIPTPTMTPTIKPTSTSTPTPTSTPTLTPTPTPTSTSTSTPKSTPTLTPTTTPTSTSTSTPTSTSTSTPTSIPTPTQTSTPMPTPSNISSTSLPHPVNTGLYAKISDSVELVNMRSSASGSSSIICAIPKNSIIFVNNYYLGWYQINYNGILGWTWGGYIAPIPSGQFVTVKDVYQLNIRSSASTTAQIIGIIKQNQFAQVLGYSGDKQWMKVTVDNIQGWAYAAYLSYIY